MEKKKKKTTSEYQLNILLYPPLTLRPALICINCQITVYLSCVKLPYLFTVEESKTG